MKIGPYDLDSIITGDAREVMQQMPDGCIDLVLTDPPYNVNKDYGEGADDARPEGEYLEWYTAWAREVYRVHSNGYLYVSCSVPQIWTLRPIWEEIGYRFQMLLIWHGPNYAGNSNTIRGQWRLLYEPIFMLLKGPRLSMLNEVRGFNSDAVIRIPRPQRNFAGEQKREHVTQKPIGLYETLIARTPGQIILDPFLGSGTTAVAAKKLGRRYIGIELSPEYCQIAERRVAETQPPLFIPDAEQAAMFGEPPPA